MASASASSAAPAPPAIPAEATRATFQAGARRRSFERDPWLWIRRCVWTVDEIDKATPIKPFPVAACVACRRYAGGDEVTYVGDPPPGAVDATHVPVTAPLDGYEGGGCRGCGAPLQELTYLRLVTRLWQAAGRVGLPSADLRARLGAAETPASALDGAPGETPDEAVLVARILVLPKPRRMRMSWLMVTLHTLLALTTPHAKVFLVSSKQEKSAELIERAAGILRRIPGVEWRLTEHVDWAHTGSVKGGLPMIEFANGARLWGVAEGAGQIRQYGATAILCDEIGTWTWPRGSYTAMVPTIEGGGQMTLISSAYPGFWAELVEGRLTA
jgi:hypothetical protein